MADSCREMLTKRRQSWSMMVTADDSDDETMNKQEHVIKCTVQTCINSTLNDLSQLANNSMKG